MIEDKELGLKMAEDPEEAFWTGFKEKVTNAIAMAKRDIEINEHILKLVERKLK